MQIIYGVTGVGIGHAVRSKAIINHLIKKHKVKIFSYGQAYDFLKKSFKDVYKLDGLELFYEENKVRFLKTLFYNLFYLSSKLSKNNNLLGKFKADLVITDYEPMTYIYAKKKKIKVIGIDNINAITKVKVPKIRFKPRILAKMATFFITRNCEKYLITSFFKQAIKSNTKVFDPILRKEIIKAKPVNGKKILVYFSSQKYESVLTKVLSKVNEEFVIYGFNKDITKKNMTFKKFSEKGFIDDLRKVKAVICYGGFSLISEALFLKKPLLVLPIKDHYEQLLNSYYVEKNKFGKEAFSLNLKVLRSFLINLPKYQKNLSKYDGCGNKELFNHLDKIL